MPFGIPGFGHGICANPLEYYTSLHSFEDQNAEYIRLSLEYSIQAIDECIISAGINKYEITDLIFLFQLPGYPLQV